MKKKLASTGSTKSLNFSRLQRVEFENRWRRVPKVSGVKTKVRVCQVPEIRQKKS